MGSKNKKTVDRGDIILALDLSLSRTGYCIGTYPSPQLLVFGCIETDSSEYYGTRLRRIISSISSLITKFKCSIVVVEELKHIRNASTVRVLAGLRGAFVYAIWSQRGLQPIFLLTQEIKKSLGLGGNVDKLMVYNKITSMYPELQIPGPKSGLDESDAISVYLAACKLVKRSR